MNSVVALALVCSLICPQLIRADPPFFSLPSYEAPPYDWVEEVHVVYKTHLDVGYTGLTNEICDLYFFNHYPLVLDTVLGLKGRPEKFVYTTDAWLLSEFFDGLTNCTNNTVPKDLKAKISSAIQNGYLNWHAGPFSIYGELLSAEVYEAGLDLARALSEKFNKTYPVVVSIADVPGLSRALLKPLSKKGIRGIHVGVNAAVLPPAVPQLFRWVVPGLESSPEKDILVMVYGGRDGYGYGGNVTVRGSKVALVYNFTLDNSAPQTPATVIQLWASLKAVYPNAKIMSSSLDNFYNALVKEPIFPNLTRIDEEIGEIWVYGSASDPWRTANLRALQRALEPTLASKPFQKQPLSVQVAVRNLLQVSEHNWGLSDMQYLDKPHYEVYWSNEDFHSHINDPNYTTIAFGWADQRRFITQAVNTIIGSNDIALKNRTLLELAGLQLKPDPVNGTSQPLHSNLTIITKRFNITLSALDGSIISLIDRSTERNWASPLNPLFAFRYETYSFDDYVNFCARYTARCLRAGYIVCEDLSKLGMNNTFSPSSIWKVAVREWRSFVSSTAISVFIKLAPVDPKVVTDFGAAAEYSLDYTFSIEKPIVALRVQWRNKTATRLPEASWLGFVPAVSPVEAQSWQIQVQDHWFSPLHVVINGTRNFNALNYGSKLVVPFNATHRSILSLETIDAPIVAFGKSNILNFNGEILPDLEHGIHVNLHNNLWGTAFNQWYDDDASYRFRFQIDLEVNSSPEMPSVINMT